MRRTEPVHTPDDGRPTRLPHLRDLAAALGLLTVLPFDRPDVRSPATARATLFFPLVGGLIGLLLTATNWIIGDRLPAALCSIVIVVLWEAIGGAAAWRAPPIGGRAVVGAALLVKVAVLARHAMNRPAALLFAPMLARWAIVVLAVGARDAAAPMRKFNAAITFREFALTSVFTCAIVFTIADAFGIVLVVCVAALVLALRLLQHRRPGGTSWPLLLAGAELVELLVLGLTAAALRRQS